MRADNDLGTMFAGLAAGIGRMDAPPKPNTATRFADLAFVRRGDSFGGERATTVYPNGYGASIVRGPYTYGGNEGLYELAVMDGNGCCYSTPITDDIEGRLTPEDVTALLVRIAALPPTDNPANLGDVAP